jgi:hypothetical protein
MLDDLANQRSEINPLDRHSVRPIAPDIHSPTNGLNVIIGRPGTGKTFYMMSEAIAISHALPECHLIICATKKSFDETVIATKDGAACPVLLVSYDELVEILQILLAAKGLYNQLMREAVERGIRQDRLADYVEDIDALFTALHITDFSRFWLETVIILDDVGSSRLLRNLDSFLNNRLKLTRDDGCIWFLGCHSLNDLSPAVKSNADVVAVGKGLTPERLDIIFRQLNVGVDAREFAAIYYALEQNGARFLTVDNRAQTLCYD